MRPSRNKDLTPVFWIICIGITFGGLAACSSNENEQDVTHQTTENFGTGAPIAGTPGTTTTGETPIAQATGGTVANGPVPTGNNAGTGDTMVETSGGTTGESVDVVGTGANTAGTGANTADTGANTAGTGANTADTGANTVGTGDAAETDAETTPPGPVNLEEVGPYSVIRDQNVGVGFEAPIAPGDQGDGVEGCLSFASGFSSDEYADQTSDFVRIPDDLDIRLYTMFRPEVFEDGKKYPLITWGNGTCALPSGYGTLLEQFASYGILVIAGHSRWVSSTHVMTTALDWAFAANDNPESPYYQKIDTEKVGAAGHSQGSMATTTASRDPRVKAVILYNGGTSASKPFFAVSGDADIFGTISAYQTAIARTPQSAYIWYHDISTETAFAGHLTLMVHPERVVGPSVAWFKMMLENDTEARDYFLSLENGGCTACGNYEAGQNGL